MLWWKAFFQIGKLPSFYILLFWQNQDKLRDSSRQQGICIGKLDA